MTCISFNRETELGLRYFFLFKMKHGVRFWQKKLNRTPEHRKFLKSNLMTQLVKHEKIQTTLAKAKFVKREFELVILFFDLDDKCRQESIPRKYQNVEKKISRTGYRYPKTC